MAAPSAPATAMIESLSRPLHLSMPEALAGPGPGAGGVPAARVARQGGNLQDRWWRHCGRGIGPSPHLASWLSGELQRHPSPVGGFASGCVSCWIEAAARL